MPKNKEIGRLLTKSAFKQSETPSPEIKIESLKKKDTLAATNINLSALQVGRPSISRANSNLPSNRVPKKL